MNISKVFYNQLKSRAGRRKSFPGAGLAIVGYILLLAMTLFPNDSYAVNTPQEYSNCGGDGQAICYLPIFPTCDPKHYESNYKCYASDPNLKSSCGGIGQSICLLPVFPTCDTNLAQRFTDNTCRVKHPDLDSGCGGAGQSICILPTFPTCDTNLAQRLTDNTCRVKVPELDSGCGGIGQSICLLPTFPTCDPGVAQRFSDNTCQDPNPDNHSNCGGDGQVICPAPTTKTCDTNLLERIYAGTCHVKEPNLTTSCGGQNQAACLLPTYPSCDTNLEQSGSKCYARTLCGEAGQRACTILVEDAVRRKAIGNRSCISGTAEVSGLPAGAIAFGSSSQCKTVSACGGLGQRACCVGEATFGACSSTYVEVAGGVPSPALCGGLNLTSTKSNGHCAACGSEGAQKCTGAGITKDNECAAGLSADLFGFCSSCGGEGQQICHAAVEDMMCNRGYHPDFGKCVKDQVIAEPDCDCTPEFPVNDPTVPVKGYADLHLHMFSNLGFGGLTLWGDAFDKKGGISQALRADNYAQRTADYVINGHVHQGTDKAKVPIDLFRGQQLVHGDNHFNDLIGGGTHQHDALGVGLFSLPNGGVEWDGNGTAKNFEGWPMWNSTTHQQAYYKWLERAHRGGLQLTVMLAVTNESMCVSGRSLDYPEFGCDKSKDAIDMQINKTYELENWLTAQCNYGYKKGILPELKAELLTACATPGSKVGWFKVVKTPEEARSAIAKGQLAVVLGIEEANLFNCNEGKCTAEYVQQQVDGYYENGVRHIFPIHNFDNDYGGAATWMDTIAVGNTYATGAWYETENCPNTPAAFGGANGYGFKLEPAVTDWLAGLILGTGWDLPSYWTGLSTSCNKYGMKPLGRNLEQYLMHKGMIIDIDHMSIKAIDETLSRAETYEYPGIVASHALMFDLTQKEYRHERMRTKAQLQRIAKLGGMIGAMTQPPEGAGTGADQLTSIQEWSGSKVTNDCQASSKTWAQMYEWAVKEVGIPVGFGTDFNGISRHNAPRFGDKACDQQNAATKQAASTRVSYPFTIDGFGSFNVQETGGRIFDYNENGLAHIGLLPDMIQDVKKVGLSDKDLEPLFQSAEAYIRMWELAEVASKSVPLPTNNISALASDVTAPTVSAIVSPKANADLWNSTAVTLTLQAADEAGGSGVSHVMYKINDEGTLNYISGLSHEIKINQEGETTVYFNAEDVALNISGVKKVRRVNIDTMAPVIRARVTPAANDAGWHNSAVTVSFACVDDVSRTEKVSGIKSCTPAKIISQEGDNLVNGFAVDKAGNEASATANINIDTTAPTVTIIGISHGDLFLLSEPLPEIVCSTSDDLSGVVSEAALSVSGTASVTGEGEFTVRCTGAKDEAGNAGEASATYRVQAIDVKFVEKVDVALSTEIISLGVTITGLETPKPVSISGGSYSINDGDFTTVSSTISEGDTIRIRHLSADTVNTTTKTVITIGTTSVEFRSTTVDKVEETPPSNENGEGATTGNADGGLSGGSGSGSGDVNGNGSSSGSSESSGTSAGDSQSESAGSKKGGSVGLIFVLFGMSLLSLLRIFSRRSGAKTVLGSASKEQAIV